MSRQTMLLYLIDGQPVGRIAEKIGASRATVRAQLKEGGIVIRPTKGAYLGGRDSVCQSIKRLGYTSFHTFAQIKSLDPITSQLSELGVSEKALIRVYNAYRKLLRDLQRAGIVLPTSQSSGADIERRPTEERVSG